MEQCTIERTIAGRTLRLETGRLAKQAAGAVVATYGDTVVLAAVVSGPPREGGDFFPLTVDYREKTYAAGKIPGGFFKREARPTAKEVLTMRMIDRPVRPLFPKEFKDEVLIQTMVLATDQQNDPDILSVIAASAALAVSPLPFDGPIAACRVGYVDGEHVLNPTLEQLEYSTLEMVAAGHVDAVNMIEVGAHEVAEDVVSDGIQVAHNAIIEICGMIEDIKRKAGAPVTWEAPSDGDLLPELTKKYRNRIKRARGVDGKQARSDAVQAVMDDIKAEYCPEDAEEPVYSWAKVREVIDEIQKDVIAERIIQENIRSDGRGATDIRPLECEVAVLPRVHGSAIFQRGETQALCVVTLGTGRDEQIVDGLTEEYSKKFMLHYNFPPICVGEARRVGATSRREIGHGNLAEKSLEAVLPSADKFPYTIRLVSEILESNGSSSMASACAGCLALMDAGVPIKQPVAGISIGMVRHGDDCKLITDILGEEDHYGLMDFKVAGTQRGITAIQLDLKGRSISLEQIKETLSLAKDARMKILRSMLKALSAPRREISDHAPRILTIKVPVDKIGRVIGPGGKFIKSIEAETGANVEIDADGTIHVSCLELAGAERALEMIEAVTAEVKVGKVYTGKVASIKDFGAFIELASGQDGLCHISELDTEYVRSADDVVKLGDMVRVKVIAVDDQGRIKLSRKAVMIEEEATAPA